MRFSAIAHLQRHPHFCLEHNFHATALCQGLALDYIKLAICNEL